MSTLPMAHVEGTLSFLPFDFGLGLHDLAVVKDHDMMLISGHNKRKHELCLCLSLPSVLMRAMRRLTSDPKQSLSLRLVNIVGTHRIDQLATDPKTIKVRWSRVGASLQPGNTGAWSSTQPSHAAAGHEHANTVTHH